ncbi:MAG: hypothetical protein IPK19_34855 [Chloroflexi bacterium]|nr:hypothetical protein [Chloroflexota bacterium]
MSDDPDDGRTALVVVPEDQLSLAIGREGQNARLAAKLTGWRIDIKSVPEAVSEALESIDRPPLNTINDQYPEMVNDVRRIMAKREMAKAVMAEEFNALAKFADLVQRRLLQVQEQRRKERQAEIAAVKSTLPTAAFHMPVEQLEVPEGVIDALRPFANVGEVMLRFLVDENRIRAALREAPPNALKTLQDALDRLIIPEEAYAAAEAEEIALQQAAEAASSAPQTEEAQAAQPEGVLDAVGAQPDGERAKRPQPGREPAFEAAAPDFTETDDSELPSKKKGKKKKGRQLVYDESRGGMVVKRQRKHGPSEWEEWDE